MWIIDNQSGLTNDDYQNLKVDLNLQADVGGVVCSYSRLKNANVPFDTKAPIFINRDHKLAELIVYYSHIKCLHRGVKQTLVEIRSSFWIPRGRSFVKKLLRPCTVCRKLNTRPYEYPAIADLPESRFDNRYPFSSTGIDYLGPLYCAPVYGEDKEKVYKAWVVLFTCGFTRAISLEVAHDATARTFINCLVRFISRRGCPNTVITDKGSVFTAEETQKVIANKLINWEFNLECAPWQGGLWERLVASVKRCIKKVVGVKTITYVELQTIHVFF